MDITITIDGVETTLAEGQQAFITRSGELTVVEATHTLVTLIEENDNVLNYIKGCIRAYKYDPKVTKLTVEDFAKLKLREFGKAVTDEYMADIRIENALKNIPDAKKVNLN